MILLYFCKMKRKLQVDWGPSHEVLSLQQNLSLENIILLIIDIVSYYKVTTMYRWSLTLTAGLL